MTTSALVTSLLILGGAGVMVLSLCSTRTILRAMANGRYVRCWRVLSFLMLFFLVGYLGALGLVLSGRSRFLAVLTGVIFLFGATFVYLVVRVGRLTIDDLLRTTVSKAYFQKIIGSMADALVVAGPDRRIRTVNRSAAELVGCDERELIGRPLDELFTDAGLAVGSTETVETDCRTRNGDATPVSLSGSTMRNESGAVEGLVCVAQDITARKEAEQALQESEERYALAARGASDGLWDWNLRSDEVYYSSRWKAMLGHGDDEIGCRPDEWLSRVHPEDRGDVHEAIASHLKGRTPHFEIEQRMRHTDGRYLWVLTRGCAVRDEDGTPYRMAGSQTDITKRKRAEEELFHHATHDPLTGLPNRALLMDRLERAVTLAVRREQYLFAVLYLDVDRFKYVNDSLGHSIGDDLLSAAAERLERCVRATDTVARLGGDEFVLLLEEIRDVSDAIRVAERVREEFTEPFVVSDHELCLAASLGIVISETGYENAGEVIRDADIAMYRAKSKGGRRYEIFDTRMRDRMTGRLELENDLRRAIERNELRAFYQPIIELASGRLSGFEALVRWQHPARGLIPPVEFIGLAEETGLIIPLDRWVLREACGRMKAWQEQFPTSPPLMISTNLSSKQFSTADLVSNVVGILRDTGLSAESLKLEITESTLIENVDSIVETLTQLKALGIEMKIDDFGTGYSSLSYLHRLPVDMLKIDRSFVSNMESHGSDLAIVRSILLLAHALGIRVVAEGVETVEQAAQLRDLDCDYGQGYLFSKPVDLQSTTAVIAQSLGGPGQGVTAALTADPRPPR